MMLTLAVRARLLVAEGSKEKGQDVSSSISRRREELAQFRRLLKDKINFPYPLQIGIDSNSILFDSFGTVKLDSEKLGKRLSKTGISVFYVFLNGIT